MSAGGTPAGRPAWVAGIDLGGTRVRVGIFAVEPTGQPHPAALQETDIEAAQGPVAGIERIAGLVESARAESGAPALAALGMGATGPVDPARGLIQNPYTLPGWDRVDIRSPLSARFDAPVVLENDADAAALGEYWAGAGVGVSRLYAVTVGTGIGVALVVDGHVYRGLGGAHPDGGHHVVDPSGPACYCGAHGCWESLASGPAIARRAREALERSPSSILAEGDPAGLDAARVAAAARQGDPLAVEVLAAVAHDFSLGLANVILLFTPEMIVLSGGVMRSLDLFRPAIAAMQARRNVMVPAARVQIVPARLGHLAGAYGAACAAWQSIIPGRESAERT